MSTDASTSVVDTDLSTTASAGAENTPTTGQETETPPTPPAAEQPITTEIEIEGTETGKKAANRSTRTVVTYKDENEYLQRIISRRIEAGLSRDTNHFLRQCIDFTINHQFNKGTHFATGEDSPTYLKDAFYQPSK